MFIILTFKQADWETDKDSMTTLISCVIYVSSSSTEAQEPPGFGLIWEMTEKRLGSFRDPS